MDPAAVRSLLATSLDPDADSRRRAELQLKQVRPACVFVFASLVEVVEGTELFCSWVLVENRPAVCSAL